MQTDEEGGKVETLELITSFSAFERATSDFPASGSQLLELHAFHYHTQLQLMSMITITIMSADDQAFLDIVRSIQPS
jgi:hypothetical protein